MQKKKINVIKYDIKCTDNSKKRIQFKTIMRIVLILFLIVSIGSVFSAEDQKIIQSVEWKPCVIYLCTLDFEPICAYDKTEKCLKEFGNQCILNNSNSCNKPIRKFLNYISFYYNVIYMF